MSTKLKANSNVVSTRVKPNIKRKLEAMAKADNRKVAYVVAKILTDYFGKFV